jgi:hypothetical protein
VQAIDGNHVVFGSAVMNLRLGERVEIRVFPDRDYGIGQGIVTDVDKTRGLIAVVILPYRPSSKPEDTASFGDLAIQSFLHSKGKKTFWLYLSDVVYLYPYEKFTLDYPRYKLPPPPPKPNEIVHKDIDFPYSIYSSYSSSASSSTPSTP